MTNKILAIIPARGGSKGLTRKNIIDLNGRPLIAWTIEASLNSKYITKTVVSSEDEEILSLSKKYGAEVVERPEDLASDYATSESVVKHAIDYLESMGEVFDIIILLQPTSPLRNYKDIDSAFDIMLDSNATSVISVCKANSKILKAFIKESNGFIKNIYDNKYPSMRRQDLPSVYMPNGAIYIIKKENFIKNNSFYTNNTLPFIMDIYYSPDIDTQEDLTLVKKKFYD